MLDSAMMAIIFMPSSERKAMTLEQISSNNITRIQSTDELTMLYSTKKDVSVPNQGFE
jgi:hypothetical protein